MDSSPVDAAWDEEGLEPSASDPPPSSEDHRSPLRVIADLRHPHLIAMLRNPDGIGFQPDLAGGRSLAELSCSEAGWFPLPLRVGLRVLLDALSGLAAVHQATQNGKAVEFVHGELAPSNIIVGRDGRGRLIPVLPAHWNERAQASPDVTGYIAPERLLGDVFGQPADVFSAGVLLWEAITGKPLFRNWPLDAIVTQLIGRKVPYPIPFGDALWGVPLADVAMRALLVDPAERWPHVGALGAQVETIARGHLASSDEIAALVAGFAAGKGRPTTTSTSDAATIPPPAAVPAPAPVTSLSPTVNSIQSPPQTAEPVALSVAPVEVPAPEAPPAAERWVEPGSAPRIWLPVDGARSAALATQPSAIVPSTSDIADSWSGVAPRSAPGQRRTRTVVVTALAASAAITAFAAYHLLDRSPETRGSASALAPKGGPAPTGSSAAARPNVEPSSAPSQPSAESLHAPNEAAGTASVGAPPTTAPGLNAPAPVVTNRPAPRIVARPAVPQPAPVNTAPRAAPPPAATTPAAPPSPAPAAKPPPKPKEDIFGI